MRSATKFRSADQIPRFPSAGIKGARVPIMRPSPPALSQHVEELLKIEESGIYTNYGPVNERFERELTNSIFHRGSCVTVCNATIGLMMAIREVIGEDRPATRRYALMPSFTFAATAHAALWCGLTPLLCDIDPKTWLPSAESEEALLKQYAGEVAVIVPYATFGNNLDLERYRRLAQKYSVPIVVDAAASLGSLDNAGEAFGSGFEWPLVFSMHATKGFSVGEGGVIYCGDPDRIARLRTMGSFGFGEPRSATGLGLNAKLTEVAALTALLKLREFPEVLRRRMDVAEWYEKQLRGHFETQQTFGRHQMQAFESVLLPREHAPLREVVLSRLSAMNIGAATYFSPHLAEQQYFMKHSTRGPLPVTEDIAGRVISLPLIPEMTAQQVSQVVNALREAKAGLTPSVSRYAKGAELPREVNWAAQSSVIASRGPEVAPARMSA